MNELETSFHRLLRRQPTDAEKRTLYEVRDALGLDSNDALWLILMALQSYQTLYESMPGKIEAATTATLNKTMSAAENSLKVTAEETRRNLALAVADSARAVAHDTAAIGKWRWGLGCVAVTSLALILVGWFGYAKGERVGYATGREETISEVEDSKAACNWASTPEGVAAYRLSLGGDIRHLLACDMPSWQIKNGGCHPYPDPKYDAPWGWRLPTARQRQQSPVGPAP